MAIFVHLFIRNVIRKVTIVIIKYHMTLNIIVCDRILLNLIKKSQKVLN